MIDASRTASEALRAQMSSNARSRAAQLAEADKFITELQKTGTSPDPQRLQEGQKLLQNIETGTELYMFHAGVLAGQDPDMAKKIDDIGKGIDQALGTADRLRQTLNGLPH